MPSKSCGAILLVSKTQHFQFVKRLRLRFKWNLRWFQWEFDRKKVVPEYRISFFFGKKNFAESSGMYYKSEITICWFSISSKYVEYVIRSDFFRLGRTYLRNQASNIGLVYHSSKVWWRRMSLQGPFYNQGQIWPLKMALKIQNF